MKLKTVFTLVATLTLFYACQKVEEKQTTSQSEELLNATETIRVENGMLAFPSKDGFLKTMAEWNEMGEDASSRLLSKFNFDSYYNDTIVSKTIEITPDLLLQKVINNKGALKINDTILVMTPSEDIIIKDGSLTTYEDVANGKISGSNIERKKVVNNLKMTQEISLTSSTAPNTWYGQNNYYSPEEVGNGRPERVRTTLYAQTRSAYASCGLRIKGEAYRRCGLWCVDWRADEIVQVNVLPNSSYQVNFFTQNRVIPAGTIANREETTIFSFPSPGGTAPNGDNFGFQNLQVHLSYKKLHHNPTRTISLRVVNGILQAPSINW